MEKKNSELEIHIETVVSTNEQIKDMAKLAAEIQKEYSCHCTLSVKIA